MATGGSAASVTTQAVTDITATSVVAHGTPTPGSYPITGLGFMIGTTSWTTGTTPPYSDNQHPYTLSSTAPYSLLIEDLLPSTTYYLVAYIFENNPDFGNGVYYGSQVSFTTPAATPPEVVIQPEPEIVKEYVSSSNRELHFKIEKLDSDELVLDSKIMALQGGKVSVGTGGFRRKCEFSLLEELPDDWQSFRWKLYYGYRTKAAEDILYHSLGVFIPVNPTQKESNNNEITSYQGVDKSKLFADYQLDTPITFLSGTTVRDIIIQVAGWFGETKLNLDKDLGTLGADFSFEEGVTAEGLLNELVSSFNADWYYDTDGYLIGRRKVAAATRPVRFEIDSKEQPLYLSSEKVTDDSNYYNRVTVVGGMMDTPIYRKTIQDDAAIALAGGRIVQRYFTINAAVTQTQVDGRATFYLEGGVQLPVQLNLNTLVIPNLEIGDIIKKESKIFEVRSFDIPLGLGTQSISAGEVQ
jgi:hypothetical protein